jgi:hypothetical protein
MPDPRSVELSGVHVAQAATAACFMLERTDRELWSRDVPDLDWTVSQTVAHAAEGCIWYAIDLAAGGRDLQTVEHRVRYDRDTSELIATNPSLGKWSHRPSPSTTARPLELALRSTCRVGWLDSLSDSERMK